MTEELKEYETASTLAREIEAKQVEILLKMATKYRAHHLQVHNIVIDLHPTAFFPEEAEPAAKPPEPTPEAPTAQLPQPEAELTEEDLFGASDKP